MFIFLETWQQEFIIYTKFYKIDCKDLEKSYDYKSDEKHWSCDYDDEYSGLCISW